MSDTFALIIGNNSYFEPFNLNNAIFDAQAIKNVFVNLGYDVVEYYDVDIAHIVEVLRVINNSSLKNIHRLCGIYRQAKEFFDKFSI